MNSDIIIVNKFGSVAIFDEFGGYFHLKKILKGGNIVFDLDNEVDSYFSTSDNRVNFIRNVYKINPKDISAVTKLTQLFSEYLA